MGLLSKLKAKRQTKKVERLVRDKLAEPRPAPSQIAEFAATLPRGVKRAHKLSVRRQFRSPAFKGITPSTQRQILAQAVITQAYIEDEHERQRQEDERYGVAAFDRVQSPVKDRSRRFGVRRTG